MNSPVFIRPARLSERDALFPLFEEIDELHRHARPDVFREPLNVRREPNALDRLIAGPESIVLVADSNGNSLLGLAIIIEKTRASSIISHERRFAELDHLIVRFDARRRGIGRSLLNAGRQWAQSRGLPGLEVSVWSFNDEARSFYRQAGFEGMFERLSLSL